MYENIPFVVTSIKNGMLYVNMYDSDSNYSFYPFREDEFLNVTITFDKEKLIMVGNFRQYDCLSEWGKDSFIVTDKIRETYILDNDKITKDWNWFRNKEPTFSSVESWCRLKKTTKKTIITSSYIITDERFQV